MGLRISKIQRIKCPVIKCWNQISRTEIARHHTMLRNVGDLSGIIGSNINELMSRMVDSSETIIDYPEDKDSGNWFEVGVIQVTDPTMTNLERYLLGS